MKQMEASVSCLYALPPPRDGLTESVSPTWAMAFTAAEAVLAANGSLRLHLLKSLESKYTHIYIYICPTVIDPFKRQQGKMQNRLISATGNSRKQLHTGSLTVAHLDRQAERHGVGTKHLGKRATERGKVGPTCLNMPLVEKVAVFSLKLATNGVQTTSCCYCKTLNMWETL